MTSEPWSQATRDRWFFAALALSTVSVAWLLWPYASVLLFAATFAEDYIMSKQGSEAIAYQKKADRKPAKASKPARAAKLPVVSDKLSELTSLRETSQFTRGA